MTTTGTTCPAHAPTSDLGYCPCTHDTGPHTQHRCTHGDTWTTPTQPSPRP